MPSLPPTVTLQTAKGDVVVRPGVIDEAAILAYGKGQCIALALALHKRTGWPIICHLANPGDLVWERRTNGRRISRAEATEGWMYHFVHALVLSPDRDLLDIYGWRMLEEYAEGMGSYGSSALVMVDGPTLRAALADIRRHGAVRMEQDERTAAAFADTLMRDYEARFARHPR